MANEKRLIDANDLAEQVDNLCAGWNENWIGNDNQSFILHSDVSDLISDAPTVDAVEVVHGRWERVIPTKSAAKWSTKVSCSVCRRQGYTHHKFCPNCGAKMDGVGND